MRAGRLHHADQHRRAETAIDGDTFAIEAIDEFDDVLRGADLVLFDEAVIAHHGELAKNSVEQMSCHVADFPCGREGLEVPFFGAEGAEEVNELCIDAAEQWRAKDGFGAGDVVGHE